MAEASEGGSLTEKKTEDVERHEQLLLAAAVNAVVVVAERGGSSVPCLLGHGFLIRVRLHLRSPTVSAPKVLPHDARALLSHAVSQSLSLGAKNTTKAQRSQSEFTSKAGDPPLLSLLQLLKMKKKKNIKH